MLKALIPVDCENFGATFSNRGVHSMQTNVERGDSDQEGGEYKGGDRCF